MKRWRRLLTLLVLAPLVVNAETISWTWAPTWTDNTAVSAADQAKMTAYLRLWKDGAPTAKTYFGETRSGGISWTDNIMVRANEFGAAVPGWVPLKAWDNVNVTVSAAFRSPVDNVERDSSEGPPYRWMIKGPASVASISANPATIPRGACATLTWTTTNAFTASVNQGIGNVALSGSRQVCPTASTPYTITATNPGGSAAAVASVAVTVPTQPGCNIPGNLTITD
jgi:hypothetical protein